VERSASSTWRDDYHLLNSPACRRSPRFAGADFAKAAANCHGRRTALNYTTTRFPTDAEAAIVKQRIPAVWMKPPIGAHNATFICDDLL
jgi:hypothetical protein